LRVRHFNFNLPGANISQQQEAMEQLARDVFPLIPKE